MTTKRIDLKVSINCQKCKTAVLRAVTKLTGVDEVKLDAEKGILTVVGTVDPVCLTTRIRKAGNYAEITSVGPPKNPDPPKPESPKPESPEIYILPLPPCCQQCQLVGVSYFTTYDHSPGCSIL